MVNNPFLLAHDTPFRRRFSRRVELPSQRTLAACLLCTFVGGFSQGRANVCSIYLFYEIDKRNAGRFKRPRSGRPCVCRVARNALGPTHSADARPATTGTFSSDSSIQSSAYVGPHVPRALRTCPRILPGRRVPPVDHVCSAHAAPTTWPSPPYHRGRQSAGGRSAGCAPYLRDHRAPSD